MAHCISTSKISALGVEEDASGDIENSVQKLKLRNIEVCSLGSNARVVDGSSPTEAVVDLSKCRDRYRHVVRVERDECNAVKCRSRSKS